jgi:large subunit ribosomal protein L13
MKTITPKKDQFLKEWVVIDATDKVLGRLSTQIVALLRGKHRPIFTPNLDTGDNVVIINAEKVRLTGNKELAKTYRHFSGFQGGLKTVPYRRMLQEKPEEIIRHAVWGMLPKTTLSRQIIKNLRIYVGPEHPHHAQNPKTLEL